MKCELDRQVIAIGFPLGSALGVEPTVSVGIISAERDDGMQTAAYLNPGNSGGPVLNMFGQAIGLVVSRVAEDSSGRPISAIGFAIPINKVRAWLGETVLLPGSAPTSISRNTPTPTMIPTATPDLARIIHICSGNSHVCALRANGLPVLLGLTMIIRRLHLQ